MTTSTIGLLGLLLLIVILLLKMPIGVAMH
jgi:hypothetical protein